MKQLITECLYGYENSVNDNNTPVYERLTRAELPEYIWAELLDSLTDKDADKIRTDKAKIMKEIESVLGEKHRMISNLVQPDRKVRIVLEISGQDLVETEQAIRLYEQYQNNVAIKIGEHSLVRREDMELLYRKGFKIMFNSNSEMIYYKEAK